jgi:hypothetical protein
MFTDPFVASVQKYLSRNSLCAFQRTGVLLARDAAVVVPPVVQTCIASVENG